MHTHADRTRENKSSAGANPFLQNSNSSSISKFVDNRLVAVSQRKLQELAHTSPIMSQQRAFQKSVFDSPPLQRFGQLQERKALFPESLGSEGIIQREKWKYTDRGWKSMDDPDRLLSPENDHNNAIEGIGRYNGSHKRTQSIQGDIFDDETGQMFTSDNLSMVKTGWIEAQETEIREARLREAFSHTKAILAGALRAIGSTLENVEALNGSPRLKHALNMSFPFTQHLDDADLVQRGGVLGHIYTVTSRISEGLSSPKAVIRMLGGIGLSMGSLMSPFTKGAKGFVLATPLEVAQHSTQAPYTDLWQMYGDIHVAPGSEEPWTIIHEATHKFAGADDIQYSSRTTELKREDDLRDLREKGIPTDSQERTEYTKRSAAPRDQDDAPITDKTGSSQEVWYRMGRRALKNADSYAYFIMMLGDPSLKIPRQGPH